MDTVREPPETLFTNHHGIKNPFKLSLLYVYSIGHYIREEEENKILQSFVKISGDKTIFIDTLKKELSNNAIFYLEPVFIDYENKIKYMSKKHAKKIVGKTYVCNNKRDSYSTTLFFQDQYKHSVNITINLTPFYEAIFKSLNLTELVLSSYKASKEYFDYKLFRALTKDDIQKRLYYRAYFDYYLKENDGKRKTKYSKKQALVDANKQYRLYDEDSKVWADNFDTIYDNFKKWIIRNSPEMIRLMSDAW